MITGRNEDDCYAAFRDFVVSILGLSTGTADSYVSYVKGVCKCVARSVDEIVSSRNSMSETIEEVDRSGKADSTKRNYISGLKAYWRFAKGVEYDAKDAEQHDSVDNTLFEIRKEVNAFELRVSDSDANFWQRIFDVSIVVLTVVPTLLTMSGITMTVMWFLVMSMLIGFMGLAALLPVLHRPVRQNLELYKHGKKLALGQVSGLNFTPEEKTLLEKKCETGVKYLLPVSMALVLVAIVKEAMDPAAGAQIEINAENPLLTTSATKPGLVYTLRLGREVVCESYTETIEPKTTAVLDKSAAIVSMDMTSVFNTAALLKILSPQISPFVAAFRILCGGRY